MPEEYAARKAAIAGYIKAAYRGMQQSNDYWAAWRMITGEAISGLPKLNHHQREFISKRNN